MATASNMSLYSLTIQPPIDITQAIVGQFSGTQDELIVAATGSRLLLYRPGYMPDRVEQVLSHDIFAIIRSIASFRMAGSHKDYIILVTDSGCISVIEFLPDQNRFSHLVTETFGKSGIRRTIPGQYLAVDPKGRACLLASIEKNKLAYVLNRNKQAELTISSPIEAHKHGVLVLSMVALDVGYDNPVFASLEIDYSGHDATTSDHESADVELVYYELDLGLNHVVRKWSDPVDPSSSLLFQVPGGSDGPSGVLVCGDGIITYRHPRQAAISIPIPIPRRGCQNEDMERKRVIVCGSSHKLRRSQDAFFFLLQTEDGDIFKATFKIHSRGGKPTGIVSKLILKYFDTIPVANSLCMTIPLLFAPSDHGSHALYELWNLGDNDEVEFSSSNGAAPTFFRPRPTGSLKLAQRIEATSPILAATVDSLMAEDASPIFSVSGSGARSRFRVSKHGLQVKSILDSELPGTMKSIWTTKLTQDENHDAYVVLGTSAETLVMSIGEQMEQVDDSGLLTSVPTLDIQQTGDEGLVQIHRDGIRQIRNGQTTDWPLPQHQSIIATATNQRQVVVALSSGELAYFEVDVDGSLAEYDERKEMPSTVTCLGLGQVPHGRQRFPFLAVGCDDCTVRILSLEPGTTLESKSMQATTAVPSALVLTMTEHVSSASSASTLSLHVGLCSGMYLRTLLDEVTGGLTDPQSRLLGLEPVKLFPVRVEGKPSVLALGFKPWLAYSDPVRGFMLTPLNCEALDGGSQLSSKQCEEGIIGIRANRLRIFSVEDIQQNLIHRSVPLTYTPRTLVKHPDQPLFYTIESENNTLAPEPDADVPAPNTFQMIIQNEQPAQETLDPEVFGYPRASGKWVSCISVVDPTREQVLQRIHLEHNEAAVSAVIVAFSGQDSESFLIIGTGRDMTLNPRNCSEAFLRVYRFHHDGRELEFIHKTEVEEPPKALFAFQGRLIAGIGKMLRIYDLGMQQLLRKAEAEVASQLIVTLQAQGNRIVVGDVQQGVTMVEYEPDSNILVPIVDDTVARWVTCTAMVDYKTVAGGDKFGNMWLLRCPEKASRSADDLDDGPSMNTRNHLGGAPHRLDVVAHFFTQDIPTSISKTNLVAGGQEVLVWTGLQGTVGLLIPFNMREDVHFFRTLETLMRREHDSLVGSDHLMYRSYYAPVKGIIDGDLCERYRLLPGDKKESIAVELDRSVGEVERKISVCPPCLHQPSMQQISASTN